MRYENFIVITLMAFVLGGWSQPGAAVELPIEGSEYVLIDLNLSSEDFNREFRLLALENQPAEFTLGSLDQQQAMGSMVVTAQPDGEGMILLNFEWLSGKSAVEAKPKAFQMMVAEGEAASLAIVEPGVLELEIGVIAERADPDPFRENT